MATKHGLGRGLKALIGETPATPVSQPQAAPAAPPEKGNVQRVPIARVKPSPWQPRHQFSTEAMTELVSSVREHGVLQPMLVRRVKNDFELIAGERRLRAATEAGLTEVPVIVMELADHEALEVALIENLQREDLNIIEEAEGYKVLGEKFQLTQDQIAQRVGKSRPSITNALRLLGLPVQVRQFLSEDLLSEGHAKVLLGVDNAENQVALAQKSVQEGWSVRDLERRVAHLRPRPVKPRQSRSDMPEEHVRHLTDLLHQHFGTSVHLQPCRSLANGKKTKGSIEIDYFSNDDLDRILQILGLTEKIL